MEADIISIISNAYQSFLKSDFFYYLKILSAFVSILLFIDIILLLSKRVRTDLRVALYGAAGVRFKKAKYNPRWEAIERRLEEGSVASGKMALIEADKMLDEALGILGYAGKDTTEKIGNIKPGQLVGIAEVRNIHEFYRRIVDDPSYDASLDEIKAALSAYERLFRGVGMIG